MDRNEVKEALFVSMFKGKKTTNKPYDPVLIRLLRPKSKKAAMMDAGWNQDLVDAAYLKDLELYVEELEGHYSRLLKENKQLETITDFKVKCYQVSAILTLILAAFLIFM